MKSDDFEALIAPYEKMIYNIAYRYVSNAEDAEDVAQDAIVKIYKSLPRALAKGGFSLGRKIRELSPGETPGVGGSPGGFDASGFKACLPGETPEAGGAPGGFDASGFKVCSPGETPGAGGASGGFDASGFKACSPGETPGTGGAPGGFDASGFKAWAARITINTAIDELRRRRKRQAQNLDAVTAAAGGEGPEERAMRLEAREALASAIGKLSDTYREIIILRDVQGFTYEELAEALRINIGTVKSRLSRARLALRDMLTQGPE